MAVNYSIVNATLSHNLYIAQTMSRNWTNSRCTTYHCKQYTTVIKRNARHKLIQYYI